MIGGLALFTVANASLMTIAADFDESGDYNDKVDGLIQTCKETKVGRLLQLRVHRSLFYNEHHNNDSMSKLVNSLPLQLKMKLTAYVYQDKYTNLKFLKDKTTKFITWVCPLMKADFFEQDEYFFHEGDQVDSFFFIKSGEAQFVLQEYDNLPYITVSNYNHFGIIDIVSSSIKN